MHGSQMIYAIALILLQASQASLASLFTPPRPVAGRYEVSVSADPIETVAAVSPDTHFGPVEVTDWFGAFGAAGTYDRARVARLYGGQGVRVARGWRQTGNGFESVTLISPYPDASLTRLNPGTLTIRFVLTR